MKKIDENAPLLSFLKLAFYGSHKLSNKFLSSKKPVIYIDRLKYLLIYKINTKNKLDYNTSLSLLLLTIYHLKIILIKN